MAFSTDVIRAAWKRQEGLCALCNTKMIFHNHNKPHVIGAWRTTHITLPKDEGKESVGNCALVHIDCHYKGEQAGGYQTRTTKQSKNQPNRRQSRPSELGQWIRDIS